MTATGKRARKRYGNRFAAKARREPGSKRNRTRRTFGALKFSVRAGNVPMGAVYANEEYLYRVMKKRREMGYRHDDVNLYVPVGSEAAHA